LMQPKPASYRLPFAGSASSQRAAMQLLEEALLAIQPYRVIRIIADEGAAVLPVLKKIAFQTEQPEYSGPLDGLYVNQVLFDTYEVSTHHKGITSNLNEKAVKLSQKHKIILTLLAQGYKNADIVSISGLSINTIKTYIKLMYEKLGVNKAADAVMEAKRRGLIEP
jgi:LuxR family transcriptional regulator, maltose regulon positive regulatory protein